MSRRCSKARTACSARSQPGSLDRRQQHDRAGRGAPSGGARGRARVGDDRRAGQRRGSRRDQRVAVDHDRRRGRGRRARASGARSHGQPRAHRAHRRVGIGSALQGLQPDGDRRHARRGQRSLRARAQGRRRSGPCAHGAARRIREQPCARRARRAHPATGTTSPASAPGSSRRISGSLPTLEPRRRRTPALALEMERRYRLLAEVHARSIDFYNRAIADPAVRKRLALSDAEASCGSTT